MSSEAASLLSARHYRWLALVFALVALFGSLMPFDFQPIPLEVAVARFRGALAEPVHLGSLSDWVSNVLLFIPLGYLLTAAFAVDHPRISIVVAIVVVGVCAFYSASIEFTQLYFPPRVTSLNDIVAETIGATLGAVVWLVIGQTLTAWARRDDFGLTAGAFPVEFLPCYVVALVFVELLPLKLTIEPAELYHKYKEGKVRLVSFLPWPGLEQAAEKELENFFLYLPVGVLLAGLGGNRWRQWDGWRWVLCLGLLLAALIQGLQLVERTSTSSASRVLTDGLAILLGWVLGVAIRKSAAVRLRGILGGSDLGRVCFGAALVLWIAAVAFLNWLPFDFSVSRDMAIERMEQVRRLPFEDYWQHSYLEAFKQIFRRLAQYFPVGLILPLVVGRPGKVGVGFLVIALVAACAVMVEIGQAFLPTRTPSLTDVLVESLGAWLGYWCASRLWTAPGPAYRPARVAGELLYH
jgi:VanZ family protein